VWSNLPASEKGEAVRAVLLALTLFLACDARALDLRCATFGPQQLVGCLQECPDAQRGAACRKNCIREHDKLKSACKRPPFIAPGPLVNRHPAAMSSQPGDSLLSHSHCFPLRVLR
jgi:hypothetical protein